MILLLQMALQMAPPQAFSMQRGANGIVDTLRTSLDVTVLATEEEHLGQQAPHGVRRKYGGKSYAVMRGQSGWSPGSRAGVGGRPVWP